MLKTETRENNTINERESEPIGGTEENVEIKNRINKGKERDDMTAMEHQNNVGRLTREAEAFIEGLEAKKKGLFDAEPSPLITIPENFVLTLERQKILDRKRGFWNARKNNFREFTFKLRGIKEPKKLNQFIHYLEEHIVAHQYDYIKVDKALKDQKIKEYENKGYAVQEVASFDINNEITLNAKKDIPYQFNSGHIKKLASLLGQPNDPIEIIERLKCIGVQVVDKNTLNFSLEEDLLALTSTKGVNAYLKKLEEAGIRGYHFFSETIRGKKLSQFLLEASRQEEKNNFLNPDNQQIIKKLSGLLRSPINISQLDDCLVVIQDKKTLELLQYLFKNVSRYDLGPQVITNLRILKEEGLAEETFKLLNLNFSMPPLIDLFSSYRASSPDTAKQIVRQELHGLLSNPTVKEFLNNKKLLDFARKTSLLLGQKISGNDRDLQKYRKLQEYPESLALLGVMRKFQAKPPSYQWENRFDDFVKLLENKEKMNIVLKPEFENLVLKLKTQLGYEFDWLDLDYEHRSIIKLFKNTDFWQKLLSPQGIELINYLGKFEINRQEQYQDLLEIDNVVLLMKNFEKTFNFRYDLGTFGITGTIEIATLKELASNQTLQNKLFSEETKALVDNLATKFNYRFSCYDVKILTQLAQDKAWQDRVFNQDNIEFIKKTVGGFALDKLDVVSNIDKDIRGLILKLAESFGYKLNLNYSLETELEKLQTLLNNIDLQKQLFAEPRIGLIKEIKAAASGYYKFQLDDINSLLRLPPDFGLFLQELKSKYDYYFAIQDIENLGILAQNKNEVFDLLDGFEKVGVSYNFRINEVEHLVTLSKYAEQMPKLLKGLREHTGYRFNPSDVEDLISLLEYDDNEIKNLMPLYRKYQGDTDVEKSLLGEISLHNIIKLAPLLKNEATIIALAQEFKLPSNEFIWYIEKLNLVSQDRELKEGIERVQKNFAGEYPQWIKQYFASSVLNPYLFAWQSCRNINENLPTVINYLDKVPPRFKEEIIVEASSFYCSINLYNFANKEKLAENLSLLEPLADQIKDPEKKSFAYQNILQAYLHPFSNNSKRAFEIVERLGDKLDLITDNIEGTNKDRAWALLVKKFTDLYRFSLDEENYVENFPKAIQDRNLALEALLKIQDDKIRDSVCEDLVALLTDCDLGDLNKARECLELIKNQALKIKLEQEVNLELLRRENKEDKYQKYISEVNKFSSTNISLLIKKMLPPQGTEEQGGLNEKILEERRNEVEKTRRVSINMTWENFKKVLESGRFKSSWEIHNRGDSYDLTRDQVERWMGIRAKGTKNDPHPIYGALWCQNGRDEKLGGSGGSYGPIWVLLKNETIKSRTSFVFGDSFGGYKNNLFNWHDGATAKTILNLKGNAPRYVEAQILGGVTLDDIESVNINLSSGLFIPKEEFERLKKKFPQIAFNVIAKIKTAEKENEKEILI